MPKMSAGLLMYRRRDGQIEVFLVHPGGPFYARKDPGVWSIPKGEFKAGEDPLEAARREFQEETGFPSVGNYIPLDPLKQPSGKTVHAWMLEGDCDASATRSNMFSMEWPPNSGTLREFPEVDRAGWFTIDVAREKILPGQAGFIDQMLRKIG